MLHNTKVSLIAAIGNNRELGKDNKLLWHIPQDLQRFRELTSGHTIVVGRRTFESIGRALPNRTNIVITHSASLTRPGLAKLIVAHSLKEALDRAKELGENEVFVIGGGQIYQEALPFADKLYLTIVDGTFDADTFFPDYSAFTKIVSEKKGESGGLRYRFLELTRP